MSFLSAYDVPEAPPQSSTQPEQSSTQPEQTLNEEVSQVIGQLGRFWGGFQKQSQTVFETARRDFGGVVLQAQRELAKLTNEPTQEPSTSEDHSTPIPQSEADSQVATPTEGESSLSSSEITETGVPPSSHPPWTTQSFFERLQSALPPTIVSTVQTTIPETIKHASESIDLAQLRSEFQRVQGVTRAHAEEYVHKSEAMLREAVKEAGEVLKDVVKIIPPEEADDASGVVWDGTDMWKLSSADDEVGSGGWIKGKGKGKEKKTNPALAQRAVATRAEVLLKRLRGDPDILKLDPEADADVKAQFDEWATTHVDSKEGGIGGPEWKAETEKALSESVDGHDLRFTHDVLVPDTLDEEAFWKRYFFRVHQIKTEEERRKALLQDSVESDELFSWEDDEDEGTSPSASKQAPRPQKPTEGHESAGTKTPIQSPQPLSLAPPADSDKTTTIASPVFSSPRESSEDSYDIVSSGNVSRSEGKRRAKEDSAEDADSDWE